LIVIGDTDTCLHAAALVAVSGLIAGGVQAGGPAAARTLLSLALDVAAGMAHMHSLDVVHGDLKPANVLLAPAAEAEEPSSAATLSLATPAAAVMAGSASARLTSGGARAEPVANGVVAGDGAGEEAAARAVLCEGGWQPKLLAKVADFGLSTQLSGAGQTHKSGHYEVRGEMDGVLGPRALHP
jgi:serine/threonine protein kinase